jgi:hypothetical protein
MASATSEDDLDVDGRAQRAPTRRVNAGHADCATRWAEFARRRSPRRADTTDSDGRRGRVSVSWGRVTGSASRTGARSQSGRSASRSVRGVRESAAGASAAGAVQASATRGRGRARPRGAGTRVARPRRDPRRIPSRGRPAPSPPACGGSAPRGRRVFSHGLPRQREGRGLSAAPVASLKAPVREPASRRRVQLPVRAGRPSPPWPGRRGTQSPWRVAAVPGAERRRPASRSAAAARVERPTSRSPLDRPPRAAQARQRRRVSRSATSAPCALLARRLRRMPRRPPRTRSEAGPSRPAGGPPPPRRFLSSHIRRHIVAIRDA